LQLLLQKQCQNQKQCSKSPLPVFRQRDDGATDAQQLHDGVIQLSPLCSYVVLEIIEISQASFLHFFLQYASHTSQLDLNPANLEAAIEAD